jgi:capsular exopolysaccharide synthesis family protein
MVERGSHNRTAYSGDSDQPEVYYNAGALQSDGTTTIRWAWFFLRRRFSIIATTIVIGTLVAVMHGLQRPIHYTATAQVVIEPTDTRMIGIDAEAGSLSTDWTMMETQIEIARSPDFAQTVMDRLGLETQMAARLAAAETNGTTLNPALQPFARLFNKIPTDILVATGLAKEVERLQVTEDADRARRAALGYLAGGLDVRQSGNSRVLSLSFTAGNAAEAARVANAFADAFIAYQLDRKVGSTTRASSFLETRLDELEVELRAKEKEIRDYREANRLIETDGQSLSAQELSELSSELIQVRARREDLEGRIGYIRGLRGNGDAIETVGEILNSPLVSVLLHEHIQLKRREQELLTSFGERHPLVISLRADLESIVEQIGLEADRYIASLQNDVSLLEARTRAIQEQMDRAAQENLDVSQATVGLRELEREADNLRNLYNSFLVRFTETREQRQVIEPDARIIARAETPSGPSSRGLEFFLTLGLVVSGAVGVGLAWLRETLDRGLRTSHEVEAQLGLPCLGQVPHLKSLGTAESPQAYLLQRPNSAYAEAVRSVGTFLAMSNVDDPPRVIQVTSAVPGEGKSTFAMSLATTLADTSRHALLLDLDFHHPSVAGDLGLQVDTCLVDYLTGTAPLDKCLYTTDLGLTVLPIRRKAGKPAALIGSQRMRDLMALLRRRYDHVIVDSPPLLLVSDPKRISALVDTTVLLVRWQETPADKAANALRELDGVGATVAGAVLSQVDVKRQAQYGYAGVGSYYGKYRRYYAN